MFKYKKRAQNVICCKTTGQCKIYNNQFAIITSTLVIYMYISYMHYVSIYNIHTVLFDRDFPDDAVFQKDARRCGRVVPLRSFRSGITESSLIDVAGVMRRVRPLLLIGKCSPWIWYCRAALITGKKRTMLSWRH